MPTASAKQQTFFSKNAIENMQHSPWRCGLAMAAIFSWILTFPLYGPLTMAAFPENGVILANVFAVSHSLTLFVLGRCQKLIMKNRLAAQIAGALLLILTITGVLAPAAPLFLSLLYAVMGILSAYLVIGWSPWFVRQSQPALSLAIVIIGSNLFLLLAALIVAAGKPYTLMMTVIAGILALTGAILTAQEPVLKLPAINTNFTKKQNFLTKTIISLAAFALAVYVGGGIMYNSLAPVVWEAWPFKIDLGLLTYCLTALLMAFIARRYGPPAIAGFTLSTLGLGMMFATVGYTSPNLLLLSYLLIMTALGGADMYFWLSLWMLSFYKGAYRSFGFGLGSNVLIITATGIIIGHGILGNPTQTYLTGIFGTAVLFLAIPFVFQNSLPTINFSSSSQPPVPQNIEGVGSKAVSSDGANTFQPPGNDFSALLRGQLTASEEKVFNLLVTGASDVGMAEELFISRNTVKFHVRNILHKANVKNRNELLAALLLKSGQSKETSD